MHTQPILIIGANGKTGRRIAKSLSERGYSVRPGTRSAPIPFDWENQATWAPALEGVSAAYVSYFPDLAFPGAAENIEALAALANEMDLDRLVLLSGRGETQAMRCEDIVRASGVDFTLLRCAWFAQNFSEGYLRDPVLDGVIELPAGDVVEPIVDVDDIADVAVSLRKTKMKRRLAAILAADVIGFSRLMGATRSERSTRRTGTAAN